MEKNSVVQTGAQHDFQCIHIHDLCVLFFFLNQNFQKIKGKYKWIPYYSSLVRHNTALPTDLFTGLLDCRAIQTFYDTYLQLGFGGVGKVGWRTGGVLRFWKQKIFMKLKNSSVYLRVASYNILLVYKMNNPLNWNKLFFFFFKSLQWKLFN